MRCRSREHRPKPERLQGRIIEAHERMANPASQGVFERALVVWLVLIAVEFVHGAIFPVLVKAPVGRLLKCLLGSFFKLVLMGCKLLDRRRVESANPTNPSLSAS